MGKTCWAFFSEFSTTENKRNSRLNCSKIFWRQHVSIDWNRLYFYHSLTRNLSLNASLKSFSLIWSHKDLWSADNDVKNFLIMFGHLQSCLISSLSSKDVTGLKWRGTGAIQGFFLQRKIHIVRKYIIEVLVFIAVVSCRWSWYLLGHSVSVSTTPDLWHGI